MLFQNVDSAKSCRGRLPFTTGIAHSVSCAMAGNSRKTVDGANDEKTDSLRGHLRRFAVNPPFLLSCVSCVSWLKPIEQFQIGVG
jgi:hypothetical protein